MQQKLSSCSTPTEGVDGPRELRTEGVAGTGKLRSWDPDRRVGGTARAEGEKARLNREAYGSKRSHETAGVVGIERQVEALRPTDRLRELKLMQSRDEPSGEDVEGGSCVGTECARKVEFARFGFLRARAESQGLSLPLKMEETNPMLVVKAIGLGLKSL